jgi:hypothetical protein
MDEKDWLLAQEALETELGQWALLMADIPSLMQGSDMATISHVLGEIQRYADVLAKQDKPFPEAFTLRQLVWAQVEHDPITQAARGAYFVGGQAMTQKNYEAAEKQFKQSVDAWGEVLRKYPSIAGDKSLCREMIKATDAYRESLEAQKKELPKEMPLKNILDRWGEK